MPVSQIVYGAQSPGPGICAKHLGYERIQEPLAEPEISLVKFMGILRDAGLASDPLVSKALLQAIKSHEHQTRDDGSPYLQNHVLPVTVSVLREALSPSSPFKITVTLSELVAAALLHDVLEDDPDINHQEFSEEFGVGVYTMVNLLTKPDYTKFPGRSKREQKYNLNWPYIDGISQAAPEVRLIKFADRLHNVVSTRKSVARHYAERPDEPLDEKVAYYIVETERFYLPMAQVESFYYYIRLSYHLEKLKPLIPNWDEVRKNLLLRLDASNLQN